VLRLLACPYVIRFIDGVGEKGVGKSWKRREVGRIRGRSGNYHYKAFSLADFWLGGDLSTVYS